MAYQYSWQARADGRVEILFYGKPVTTLRKHAAARFVDEVERCDEDEAELLMARVTGQFRHGNERLAKSHPRNAWR